MMIVSETTCEDYVNLMAGQAFRFEPCTGYLYMRLDDGYCNLENGLYYPKLHTQQGHGSNVRRSAARIVV
jgi:hypothetical protein